MDWKTALAEVRAGLPASSGRGVQRGSLRWLESEMKRLGGNPAALRNIIYRDTGTSADKAVLRAILQDLARETGRTLDLPHLSQVAALPDELELLGRSKKRLYKQFLAGVRAGRTPRLFAWGRAGAGKTVLLGQVAQALEAEGFTVTRLNLSEDVYPGAGTALTPPAGRSFAELVAAQVAWARSVIPASGVLLMRVSADLNFGGDRPRRSDGTPVSSAAWAAEFLNLVPPQVAVLLTLQDPSGWPQPQQLTPLLPPTPSEARSYLMQKLGVNRQAADQLLKETGRHLDRLTLLAGAGGSAPQLLADPDMRRLGALVAALDSLPVSGPYPPQMLEVLLGQPAAALPLHVRAQLQEPPGGGAWWPNQVLQRAQSVIPAREIRAVLERLAATGAAPLTPWRLAALVSLHQFRELVQQLARTPDAARHLPALWPDIRKLAPTSERESLAREVVSHHAGRGEYDSPGARDALFSLLESGRDAVRAWARVKLAESSLDGGNFQASAAQLAQAEVRGLLAAPPSPDPWVQAARSDALLLQAALARWQGDLEGATRAVLDPRIVQSGPRVELWRGLIAKDAGRWTDALSHLQKVPPSSPLLSARARYQEGDLRLRLGQPQAALEALLDAAGRLEQAGGTREEHARILARAATAQRRLGQPGRGLELSGQALRLVQPDDRKTDAVLRARLLSEQVPILLALNRTDAALRAAEQALSLLDSAAQRQAEAAYRARRTHYRVALTYLTRGMGQPYLQPLHGPRQDHPDLAFARAQLDDLLQRRPDGSDREQVLTFDMHLSRTLAEPDAGLALEHVGRALDMTDHPYAEAQARAVLADVYLRSAQPDTALSEINRAYSLLRRVAVGLPGTLGADPALHAQLLALEGWATIGEGVSTLRWLRGELLAEPLRPFRAGVWREVGRALEREPQAERVLREWQPRLALLRMRPGDALALLECPDQEAGGPLLP